MNIFTIGFSQKSAEKFFTLLIKNKVNKVIDIRLNNKSQLAGFANAKHLPYFLKLHNIKYEYKPELAPSKDLLDGYKKNTIDWNEYIKIYNQLIKDRNIIKTININDFDNAVLLCSESTADQCHRRLLAEYIAKNFNNIQIKHL